MSRRYPGGLISASTVVANTGIWTMEQYTRYHDPNFSARQLLLHFEGANASTSIVDNSMAGRVCTAQGDAKLTTADKKYGGSSLILDGTGDYVDVAYTAAIEPAALNMGVECWINPDDVAGNKCIAAFQTDFHFGFGLWGDKLALFASSNGSSWDAISADSGPGNGLGTIAISAGVWTYVGVRRSGNDWSFYVADALDKTITVSTTVVSRSEAFNIGRWGNGGLLFKGKIDEFRWSIDNAPTMTPAPTVTFLNF